jgi:hypothetical protein
MVRDGEASYFKYCIHCRELSSYDIIITTNMKYHFKLKHQIIVERILGPVHQIII